MGEVDSFFQIKHICCCDFETRHLADCRLEAWRVSLDFFPKFSSPSTKPLLLLVPCFCTPGSSPLSMGLLRNPFSFMGSKGFRKSYPTGSGKMKPESVGGWGGFHVKLGHRDSPGSHLRGKHGSWVDHRGRSHH